MRNHIGRSVASSRRARRQPPPPPALNPIAAMIRLGADNQAPFSRAQLFSLFKRPAPRVAVAATEPSAPVAPVAQAPAVSAPVVQAPVANGVTAPAVEQQPPVANAENAASFQPAASSVTVKVDGKAVMIDGKQVAMIDGGRGRDRKREQDGYWIVGSNGQQIGPQGNASSGLFPYFKDAVGFARANPQQFA